MTLLLTTHVLHRYRGWEATIAWAACDWDPHWCATTVAPWARSNGFNVLWAELSDKFNAIENEYTGVANGNGRVDAERFCFSITIINVVPYIFLALAAFYALTSVALMPLVVLQWMVDVLMQSLAYIHMHAPGRRGGD